MAQLIKHTGEMTDVKPENGRFWQLKELQKIVGGYIEGIRMPKNQMMYINENGKFMFEDADINITATQLASQRLSPGDYILGNAIIVPYNEEEDYWD